METDTAAREFEQDEHRFTFEVTNDVRDRLVGHGDEHFPLHSAEYKDAWPLDFDAVHMEQIERRSELSELAKVKAELLRVLAENHTLKISYQKLLDIRKNKQVDSVSSSKHKIIAKLQEELSAKTLYCNNITEKLVSYKKKYKSIKASQSKHPQDSVESSPNAKKRDREEDHFLLEARIKLLERSNQLLSQELEDCRAREQLCKHPLPHHTGPAADALPFDWQRLIERLKLKASDVSKDASSVLAKVNDLKELLTELLGATPSTSVLGEERLFLAQDLEEAAAEGYKLQGDSALGKRKKSRYEEFVEDGSEQHEVTSLEQGQLAQGELQPVLQTASVSGAAESKEEFVNELPIRKCLSFGLGQPLPDPHDYLASKGGDKAEGTPAKPKITFGTSDEEESSLTIGNASVDVGMKDITQKLQEAKEWSNPNMKRKKLVVQKKLESSKPSQQKTKDAGFAEDQVSKSDHRAECQAREKDQSSDSSSEHAHDAEKQSSSDDTHKPTVEVQQAQKTNDSTQEGLKSGMSFNFALEPSTFKPVKLSMPPFLRSAGIVRTPNIDKKQEVRQPANLSLEDIPIKRLSTKTEEPSCMWKKLTLLVEEQKKSIGTSRQTYFSLLKEFKSLFRGSQSRADHTTHLSALLQQSLGASVYRVKDLLGLTEAAVTDAQVYQVYVLQSFLYLVFVSHHAEAGRSGEEQALVDYLLSYRNLDPFLADKFDKIVEIVTNNRHKQHPGAHLKQAHSHQPVLHHFALLKVVFQHMVLSLERTVYPCQTEEVFSSQILANKLNLGELRDSCQYVIGKASAVLEGFEFFQGLPDYLLACRQLFGLIKSVELSLNKTYYESLRGVFTNPKYRNTSQQLVVCLLFKQLNVLTKD